MVIGSLTGSNLAYGLLLLVVRVMVDLHMFEYFTFVSKRCPGNGGGWWKLSIELIPATAFSRIADSGPVSREGQYAVHKTLLGCSSWSVVPQLYRSNVTRVS